MPGGISEREALNLTDLLNQQIVAVDKLSVYANECGDHELRAICRELAGVSMQQYDRLLQQLNAHAGQSQGVSYQIGQQFSMPASSLGGYGGHDQRTQSGSIGQSSTSTANWSSPSSAFHSNQRSH